MPRSFVIAGALAAALATASPALAQDPPAEPRIPPGVTVAGVPVGDLTAEEAAASLHAFFDRPLRFRLGGNAMSVRPAALRAKARISLALDAALAAEPDQALRLGVVVRKPSLKRWFRKRARAFDRAPISTRVVLRHLRPRLTRPRPGRKLQQYPARLQLAKALRSHSRAVGAFPVKRLAPSVKPRSFGKVVVIRRGSRTLTLYRPAGVGPMRVRARFPVAVGLPAYPTPVGDFRIATMQRNPWWYPPAASWASGASPIPPGPGNPLGTRWMGLNVGAVGIHGTPDAASVGYSASHGCIRMRIASAEWLFERVRVGTPVFIRSA